MRQLGLAITRHQHERRGTIRVGHEQALEHPVGLELLSLGTERSDGAIDAGRIWRLVLARLWSIQRRRGDRASTARASCLDVGTIPAARAVGEVVLSNG